MDFDDIKDTANDLKDDAGDSIDDAKDSVDDEYHTMKGRLGGYAEAAKDDDAKDDDDSNQEASEYHTGMPRDLEDDGL